MSETIDLKELERRAYRSFFRDGLWDLYLGTILLALGVGVTISNAGVTWGYLFPDLHVVTLALYVVSMVILVGGKKLITVPRMGTARFAAPRRRRLGKSAVMLALGAAAGLVAFLVLANDQIPAAWRAWPTSGAILFSANALIVLGALAYFLDFSRLYTYAVLWALALPLSEGLVRYGGLSRIVAFMVGFCGLSGIMLVTGAVLLVRFLRTYPPTPKEVV